MKKLVTTVIVSFITVLCFLSTLCTAMGATVKNNKMVTSPVKVKTKITGGAINASITARNKNKRIEKTAPSLAASNSRKRPITLPASRLEASPSLQNSAGELYNTPYIFSIPYKGPVASHSDAIDDTINPPTDNISLRISIPSGTYFAPYVSYPTQEFTNPYSPYCDGATSCLTPTAGTPSWISGESYTSSSSSSGPSWPSNGLFFGGKLQDPSSLTPAQIQQSINEGGFLSSLNLLGMPIFGEVNTVSATINNAAGEAFGSPSLEALVCEDPEVTVGVPLTTKECIINFNQYFVNVDYHFNSMVNYSPGKSDSSSSIDLVPIADPNAGPAYKGCANNKCYVSLQVIPSANITVGKKVYKSGFGTFLSYLSGFASFLNLLLYSDLPGEINVAGTSPAVQDNTYQVQFAGQTSSYNPTDVSDLSYSSSPGLWFKAVTESGETLKQATAIIVTSACNRPYSLYYDSGWAGFDGCSIYPQAYKNDEGQGSWYWETNYYDGLNVTLNDDSAGGHPGYFLISGIPYGKYAVYLLSGITQSGQNVRFGGTYGSYYSCQVGSESCGFFVAAKSGLSTGWETLGPDCVFITISRNSEEKMNVPVLTGVLHHCLSYNAPYGFADTSKNEIILPTNNPSVQLLNSSGLPVNLSTLPTSTGGEPYVTSTVGSSNLVTYQIQGYLPTNCYNTPLVVDLQLPLGEKIDDDSIKIAGIPISTLGSKVANGEVLYPEYSSSTSPGAAVNTNTFLHAIATPSGTAITITPSQLETIAEDGYRPSPDQMEKLTQNGVTDRVLAITYQVYLSPSFKNSASDTVDSYAPASPESNSSPSFTFLYTSISNPSQVITADGADPYSVFCAQNVGIKPLIYTNGSPLNSLPASFTPSAFSSVEGLWFQSLWWGSSKPAMGGKYTVQNSQGQYLSPVENGGTFEGWKFSSTPYNFTERNNAAYFSFGGLASGKYRITQVSPATSSSGQEGQASSPALSFSETLSYSSPEEMEAISDPMNLLKPSSDVIYNIPLIPRTLPLTGGDGYLTVFPIAVGISLISLGMMCVYVLRHRRRG